MQANMPKRPPPMNKPSMLLGSDENDTLFNIIGYRCVTLATAVVQVFLAEPPSINRWTKRHCGICCFIKDSAKKSYFIRVFDIYMKTLIWEQELYNDFKYNTPRPYFHTFETDDGQAGFNFSDENEANQFKGILLEKIRPKRDRKQGKRNDVRTPQGNGGGGSNISTNNIAHLPATEKKQGKKKDKKKVKITKADIGLPTDFKHVQHVGWDPTKGFDVDLDNIDPGLRDFFNKAGISENQLKDKDTAQFIYDFIDQMGGIDRIKREVASHPPQLLPLQPGSAPPPVPIRGNMGAPPPPPTRGNMGAPPPPPARSGGIPFPPASRPSETPARLTSGSHPPPPPTRNLPPIPVSATSPVRPPQIKSPPTTSPPSVPSGGSGPPPPPPPPMAAVPLPPPLPVGGIPGAGEPLSPPPAVGRSALLEQIRQGTALNPIEQAPRTCNDGSSRGELLDQIRQGIELKPVEAPQSRAASAQPGELDGMAAALARALAERSKAIHSSDDEEEDDDEEDDDEWED